MTHNSALLRRVREQIEDTSITGFWIKTNKCKYGVQEKVGGGKEKISVVCYPWGDFPTSLYRGKRWEISLNWKEVGAPLVCNPSGDW